MSVPSCPGAVAIHRWQVLAASPATVGLQTTTTVDPAEEPTLMNLPELARALQADREREIQANLRSAELLRGTDDVAAAAADAGGRREDSATVRPRPPQPASVRPR
jgi:hypothetical protein